VGTVGLAAQEGDFMFDQKAYNKAYYLANKKSIQKRNAAYYLANKERFKEYSAKYRLKHRDEYKEYHAKWYQENKHLYSYRHRNGAKYRKQAIYSVWNNKTDEVIIIDGTAEQCAKAMGIKVESFYTASMKASRGKNLKWTIEKKMLKQCR
jgi:hypothetical protein